MSSCFDKVVVIDAKNHMLGRLASVLATAMLKGQKVVCVRTEEINISGSLFRNYVIMSRWFRKRTRTNPTHGPFHHRAPGRLLVKAVRGMLPHKTPRGAAALERLKVFEGVPHPYDRMKKQVVPQALRTLRLKPGRAFCRLGDLAAKCGWKHNELIGRLEKNRTIKGAAYFQTKKQLNALRSKAVAAVDASTKTAMAAYGLQVA